jgi:hypothetical protein
MERRDFILTSALGSAGLMLGRLGSWAVSARATRKILIAGGNYGTVMLRYMAELTGKPRRWRIAPRLRARGAARFRA